LRNANSTRGGNDHFSAECSCRKIALARIIRLQQTRQAFSAGSTGRTVVTKHRAAATEVTREESAMNIAITYCVQ
jgi:hypothetical protein